ncbi:MAG: hypothetical protein AABW54_02610 [Candidatus Micrarchaeota archaeon]
MEYVTVNLRVGKRTNRVLGVMKERYGLRDKGAALDKFAELYGSELVEDEVKDELVRDIIRSCDKHVKKHGFRKMSLVELDRIGR